MSPGKVLLFLQQLVISPGPRYTLSFWYWRLRNSRQILGSNPVRTAALGNACVRYLVCHDQVLEAIWSAKSLLADSRMQQLELVFHDDGTLSPKDVSILTHHFPCARIISRKEADIEMEKYLPSTCKALRNNLVLAKKLFDFAHFADGKPYVALDTDVLFFRDPDELYEAVLGPDSCIRWNQDPPGAVSFCHTVDAIFEKTGLRIERFNSGVLAIPHPFTQWGQIAVWLRAFGGTTFVGRRTNDLCTNRYYPEWQTITKDL